MGNLWYTNNMTIVIKAMKLILAQPNQIMGHAIFLEFILEHFRGVRG